MKASIHSFVLLTLFSFLTIGDAFKLNERPGVGLIQKQWDRAPAKLSNRQEHSTDLLETPHRGGGALTKSKVVEFHGYIGMLFGATFILESFGVAIPFIGPAAIIGGFDLNDAAQMFILRFCGSVMIGLGMMEKTFSSGEATKIFTQFHILITALTFISSKVRSRFFYNLWYT